MRLWYKEYIVVTGCQSPVTGYWFSEVKALRRTFIGNYLDTSFSFSWYRPLRRTLVL